MKILCALTCLDYEFSNNAEGLKKSFSNLKSVLKEKLEFVLIIQKSAIPCDEIFYRMIEEFCDIFAIRRFRMVDYRSVSKARNEAIGCAIDENFDKIIFHDATIIYSVGACEHYLDNLYSDYVPNLRPLFGSYQQQNVTNSSPCSIECPNPILNCYVWTYLFNVADLKTVRFDTGFGPGDETIYKSGEDVLFLYAALVENNKYVVVNRNAFVFHPPRSAGYQKHLLYALGQGKTLRILLKRYSSAYLYFHVVYFFANALARVLLLKRNSLAILIKRCEGFFLDQSRLLNHRQ